MCALSGEGLNMFCFMPLTNLAGMASDDWQVNPAGELRSGKIKT